MVSDRASVTIGILALVIGSVAVYGVLSANTAILAKPDQAKVPDYSSTLESLSSQVNSLNNQVGSIKNNLPDISTLKTSIADIHEKLADLGNVKSSVDDIQKKLNDAGSTSKVQQVVSSSGTITVSLDKASYVPGETIRIVGYGAEPLKIVQIQLLDSNQFVLVSRNTWADSVGNVQYDLQLSSSLFPGNYVVKLASAQATGSQQVTITTINALPSGYYLFTAQTDKAFYQRGDLIQISGMAQPASLVTAVMTSPSTRTFTSSTTANADGTFTILFSTLLSYETGPWGLTLTNLGQTKTFSVYLESVGSTGPYTFTAQIDKSKYNIGDAVQIFGTAHPSTSIVAVMTDPSGNTYSSSTTADSAGSYTISFAMLTSYQTGAWSITVTNLGQAKTLYFTLGSSSGSSTFTAQTDKTSYHKGDLVQIAGMAQPGSSVSATMISPSGNSYGSSQTANSYGSYVLFFSTPSSYETGSWYIDVSNLGQHKILSFTLQNIS